MTLAVTDNRLVRSNAFSSQGLFDLFGGLEAQVAMFIHGAGPFVVHGPGDVPAACGKDLGAHVFLWTAGIQDNDLLIVQVIENELFVRNWPGVERDFALSGFRKMLPGRNEQLWKKA